MHERKLQYAGFFSVTQYQLTHERYDGGITPLLQRELVVRSDAVAMVAYDPDADKIVLIEQFRVGAMREQQPWLIEIVAGLIEEGETPEQVVMRECQEEIGCKPSEIKKISEFYTTPGGHTELIHLYIGKVSVAEVSSSGGVAHEDEDIKTTIVPATDVAFMLSSGKVRSAIAIIGLQWFMINHQNIREEWLH